MFPVSIISTSLVFFKYKNQRTRVLERLNLLVFILVVDQRSQDLMSALVSSALSNDLQFALGSVNKLESESVLQL